MTLTTEPSTRTLPVSSMASVAAHTRGLLREHRGTMTKVVGLHALAAIGRARRAPAGRRPRRRGDHRHDPLAHRHPVDVARRLGARCRPS